MRFSVIGQLLAAPPDKGELKAAIEALAARIWRHPTTGEPVHFGFSTICERWYYRALNERTDPVRVLRRKLRANAGRQHAISAAVRGVVIAQYAAHKSWSIKLHHDNLVALAETQPGLKPVPSYPTLRRFMRANGLDKRRRLSPRRRMSSKRSCSRAGADASCAFLGVVDDEHGHPVAALQLAQLWDPTFRPGRSAHQAVAQAEAYVIEGYRFVVDIDLAKFFDRVNHDRLMAAVAARAADRRLLRLIRSYLTAGVLDNGLFEDSMEGTPQGGPLSPVLSNLVLDELDRALPLDDLFDNELMEASNAALALFHAGKLKETQVAARDLLLSFPDMHDGWEYLGLVHEKRGENREAAECYRRVLEIVRRTPEDYEPAFEQQFVNLIAKLDPPCAA